MLIIRAKDVKQYEKIVFIAKIKKKHWKQHGKILAEKLILNGFENTALDFTNKLTNYYKSHRSLVRSIAHRDKIKVMTISVVFASVTSCYVLNLNSQSNYCCKYDLCVSDYAKIN